MKVTVTGLPLRWSPLLAEGPQGSLWPKSSPKYAVRSPHAIPGSQEPGAGRTPDLPPRPPPRAQASVGTEYQPHTEASNRLPQDPASTPLAAWTRRRRNNRSRRRELG